MTAEFAAREPEVAEFIKNMSYPNDIVSTMLYWAEENGASADEVAAWVLTNHGDMVLSWVNDDARKKLEALL
jgi:glycine betaine/proline transport system substrate-binding protein